MLPWYVASTAPPNTAYRVPLRVTLPYTLAEFDKAKQDMYKRSIAAAAGTFHFNVRIIHPILTGSVIVNTQVNCQVSIVLFPWSHVTC